MIEYAPIVATSIPGFDKTNLVIPFQHNPYVSSYEGIKIRILSPKSNEQLYEFNKLGQQTSPIVLDIRLWGTINPGNFYKIQLAYIDENGELSPWSNAAIIKCVATEPPGIVPVSSPLDSYTLTLSNPTELFDPIVQQRFRVLNDKQVTIEDTKWVWAAPGFEFIPKVNISRDYWIEFSYKTQSEYSYSEVFKITGFQTLSFFNSATTDLNVVSNSVGGCAEIKIALDPNVSSSPPCYIYRENRSTAPQYWEVIQKIDSLTAVPQTFYDFTVEQGMEYKYVIKEGMAYAHNSNLEGTVSVDFENIFLSDGEKCLSIGLNPSISSFKETVLQSKVETLGSPYPFVFRNGTVSYKEFPISGLISYHMDNNEMFMTNEELGLENDDVRGRTDSAATIPMPQPQPPSQPDPKSLQIPRSRTTSLLGYNYTAERLFKLEVLKWLNNGRPKLFRSPTEGNYIVNLMNVNLTPYNGVNGLVHSFSCNACEIAELNYDNLVKHDLVYKV